MKTLLQGKEHSEKFWIMCRVKIALLQAGILLANGIISFIIWAVDPDINRRVNSFKNSSYKPIHLNVRVDPSVAVNTNLPSFGYCNMKKMKEP